MQILFAKDEEVSVKAVLGKLVELLASRGKKKASHSEQRLLLRKLKTVSPSPAAISPVCALPCPPDPCPCPPIQVAEENNLGVGISAKLLLHVGSRRRTPPRLGQAALMAAGSVGCGCGTWELCVVCGVRRVPCGLWCGLTSSATPTEGW